VITLTARAVKRALQDKMVDESRHGKVLRVWIAGKNCDGFIYGVAFDRPSEEDVRVEQEGVSVAIDPGSATYMAGSVLDFVDDERGQGYVVENPHADAFKGKFFLKTR